MSGMSAARPVRAVGREMLGAKVRWDFCKQRWCVGPTLATWCGSRSAPLVGPQRRAGFIYGNHMTSHHRTHPAAIARALLLSLVVRASRRATHLPVAA